MNVAELMAILDEYDPETPVMIAEENFTTADIIHTQPTVVALNTRDFFSIHEGPHSDIWWIDEDNPTNPYPGTERTYALVLKTH